MPKSSATRDHFEQTATFWRDVYQSTSVECAVYSARQSKVLEMVDALRLAPGAAALEIGCGAGWNAVALAERGLRVEATDPVEEMLRMTRALAQARSVEAKLGVTCCAGEALPFPAERFDLAVGIAVMEWADSAESMLAELARVLRPGGHLILSATNRWALQRVLDPWFNPLWAPLKDWIYRRTRDDAARARTHSVREMHRLLGPAGLQKGECLTTGFGPFTLFKYKLFPGAAGARLHERLERLAVGGYRPLAGGGYACLIHARKPFTQAGSGEKRSNTVTLVRHELPFEMTTESLSELMTRQSLRIEQVVDAAADIAKQMALLHRRGLVYGALESERIRISGGHASLELPGPDTNARTADDVRDFAVWLRDLLQALPPSTDWRRMELHEIADRYLQPESLPASGQMKKAAMALALLRVTSHSMAESEPVCVEAVAPAIAQEVLTPEPSAASHPNGTVLLLMRAISEAELDEPVETEAARPFYRLPWLAAAAIVIVVLASTYFFLRGIL